MKYNGTEQELVKSVRPMFRHLVPLALSRGILVSIVTFSPQTELIGETLKLQFPDSHAQLVIRGNDNSWQYVGLGSTAGKQAHMASAAHELSAKHGVDITRKSTLLIDDDINNIRAALKNKTPAVLFRPNNVTQTMIELQSIQINLREFVL